ncbi:nitroreductase family deazaflavin-dependent oxidoreductase [Streptomyces sp. NPDC051172]|uniref:nitroreductase family deazaflavin-dependent oxidoreductase n=1 Tax=Streptomyces sp. NPDC051172 TaxID=3155796 RepID=UPI003422D767
MCRPYFRASDRATSLTLRLAGHLAFADLVHIGHVSGTVRHTPLRALRTDATVVIGINFGRDSDWSKNIRAAGQCRMRLRGERLELAPRGSSRSRRASAACPGCSAPCSGMSSAPPSASSCPSSAALRSRGTEL